MGKSTEAAKALLEEMASNNYHWSSDRATPQRGGGKYSVDVVTLSSSRVDALAQRLEKVTSSPSPVGSSGSAFKVYAICETCGVQGHTSAEYYNGPLAVEHVNAFQGYQPPPQHSSHLTACNQGGKSYSNLAIHHSSPTSSECHAATRLPTPRTLCPTTSTSTTTSISTIHSPL